MSQNNNSDNPDHYQQVPQNLSAYSPPPSVIMSDNQSQQPYQQQLLQPLLQQQQYSSQSNQMYPVVAPPSQVPPQGYSYQPPSPQEPIYYSPNGNVCEFNNKSRKNTTSPFTTSSTSNVPSPCTCAGNIFSITCYIIKSIINNIIIFMTKFKLIS